MEKRRTRSTVATILGVYLLWTFFSSFRAPNMPYFPSEHTTSALDIQKSQDVNENLKHNGNAYLPTKLDRLPKLATVRQQLLFQFPYNPKKSMPKDIWQTWKVGVNSAGFPQNYKEYLLTWASMNPDYEHHILTDDLCEALIAHLYSPVPDVLEAYQSLPRSILKADFFRYLILFARGGIYSDIDTKALKPIKAWKSLEPTLYGKEINPGIVVGIEADTGTREDWAEWYARQIQFCQWTIMLKPGHPLLRELIAEITDRTLTRKKKGQLNSVLGKDQGGDIMNWTGPAIFTDYVFNYLNNIVQDNNNFITRVYSESITPKFFMGIQQPVMIDDVMVLPITSFSPGVNQMGSKPTSDDMAYIQHMFSGSWKPQEERM